MACRCTDNNKRLNNNKIQPISNNDKTLKLSSIQDLSIDETINLYRNGYTLENSYEDKISSLMASPNFQYVDAVKKGTGMFFIALVENNGIRGMVRFKTYNKTTNTCVEDTSMQKDMCIESSTNQYIHTLSLVSTSKSSGPQFDIGCLRMFTCSAGESCPSTCTTYSISPYDVSDNIDVGYAPGVTPNSITNYVLTPGNGTIVANWSEPINTTIFAYHIVLTRVSDSVILADGHIRTNSANIINLTNNIQYKVTITPVSNDGLSGSPSFSTSTPTTPTPTIITISSTTSSVNVGSTLQVTAVCKDQSNNVIACPTLTWTSSNPSKATINSSGLIAGVAAGTTDIRAVTGSVTSNILSIAVTVPTPVLTSIAMTPEWPTVNIGQTLQLTIICKDQNKNTITCPTLTWINSVPSVATVSPTGLITGVATGMTLMVVQKGSVASNPVNVTVISTSALASITISPVSPTINANQTVQLSATCRGQNNNTITCPTLHWWSYDTTKATVDYYSGLVTGIAEGTADIVAFLDQVTSNASHITVNPSTLTSITIYIFDALIPVNGTEQLTIVCKDQNNNTITCPTLTWSSDPGSIVTISPTGLVTAIAPGNTNIMASVGNVASNTISITVPSPTLSLIAITPTSSLVDVGRTVQLSTTCKDQYNNTMACPSLYWWSYNTDKATVDYYSGLVTGISPGIANIVAFLGSVTSNQSHITVTSMTPILSSIEISPTSPSINMGSTVQLSATCKDQYNNVMICPTLHWWSYHTAQATVDYNSGLVTGISPGTADIVAFLDQITSNQSHIAVTTQTPILTMITIAPTSQSINIGQAVQLSVTCKDQNNNVMTCPTMTWISSDTSKATVNSSGIVTGVAIGPTNITASVGNITSNASLTIVTTQIPTLTTIEISPTSRLIDIGQTAPITPICKDQNNNIITCPTLVWTSSDTSKVTINSSGIVTGVATGSTNITASANGVTSNTSLITVTTSPVLTIIEITPTSRSINVGQTTSLIPTCKDQNNNVMSPCQTLTWSSNDTSKATVNSFGIVTGIATGAANITATANGVTSNISLIIVGIQTSILTTIEITPISKTLLLGDTIQLIPVCKDQNNNAIYPCPTMTWSSSNVSKAIVNQGGLVTGIEIGTTNITASANNITSNSSAITVTETLPQEEGGAGALLGIAGVAALAVMMSRGK